MAKVTKTKEDIAYMMLYQALTILVPLITTPYISRIFGSDGIGVYSYTNSVVSYFVLFAALSYYEFGNRLIAQVRADKEARSSRFFCLYSIQLATGGLSLFAYLLYACMFAKENQLIAVIQILCLISSLADINWFFFGMEEFKLTVIRNTLVKLGMLSCIFLFVKDGNDLPVYVLIMSGGTALSNLIMWFFLRKRVQWIRPDLSDIKKMLVPVLILFFPLVARSIFVYMDKILLKNLCDYSQVGLYENAEKMILGPTSLITALGSVMLSRLSGISAKKDITKSENRERLSIIRSSVCFVFFLASAFVFGLSAVAVSFTGIYFGKGFEDCAILIRMMSFTMFPVAWCNVLRTQYLIPTGRDKVYVYSVITGAFVNLLVDLMMIPTLGARGAVWGWIAAELTIAIWQTVYAAKELPILRMLISVMPFILAGIIMLCGVELFIRLFQLKGMAGLLAQVAIGAVIYLIIAGSFYIQIRKKQRTGAGL